jgi:hypothetical protein
MKIEDYFMEPPTLNIHNGVHIRLWEDKWLRNFTLKKQYPSLYNIAAKNHILVANALRSILNI